MAEKKFEKLLGELEAIADELEKGELSLDQAIAKYEAGITLYRACRKVLDAAQKRIEVLSKKGAGYEAKPFRPGAEEPEGKEAPEETEETRPEGELFRGSGDGKRTKPQ